MPPEDLLSRRPSELHLDIIPEGVHFDHVNCVLNKKNLDRLVGPAYRDAGTKATGLLCDRLKDIGYEYATRAGVTIGVKDLQIPATCGRSGWS